jgi:transposase
MAMPLLAAVARPNRLIADKAYDADSLRNWLKIRRIKAVIPSTATRTVPYPLDRAVYRRRNLIERLFFAGEVVGMPGRSAGVMWRMRTSRAWQS